MRLHHSTSCRSLTCSFGRVETVVSLDQTLGLLRTRHSFEVWAHGAHLIISLLARTWFANHFGYFTCELRNFHLDFTISEFC